MNESDFYVIIYKKRNKIVFNGHELTNDVVIVESETQRTEYKIQITKGRLKFTNSKFGFVKVYYQECSDKIVITNIIEQLKLKRFDPKGISSILMFGYVLPNICLYEDVLALPPRVEVSINLRNYSSSWEYGRLPKLGNIKTDIAAIKKSLTLNESPKSAFLMSGGRDSRVIACLNKSKSKKTFTFKLNDFRPDELDSNKIDTYRDDIKGNNSKILLNSFDNKIVDSYKSSTEESFDHVHAGRWKFDYFIKEISEHNLGKYSFVNGQTADTIISLNLTGDNSVSRIRRAAFYGGIEHTLVKNMLKASSHIFSKVKNKHQSYFKGLVNCKENSEYYAGYLVNNIEFPGIEESKRKYFENLLGSDLTDSIYKEVNDFIQRKEKFYNPDEKHLMMLDICLNTFIWGMDMRGLREACHRYGHDTNFIFMNDKVISELLSLSRVYTSPLSDYKKVLTDIENEFQHEIYETSTQAHTNGNTSFESMVLSGSLGDYWRELIISKEFIDFCNYIFDEYGISLNKINVTANNYAYMDRVVSLFSWYKKYIIKHV